MIKKAYNKIFLGLLFVFFYFHINQFDLLPDFIGYFLVMKGLSDLSAWHPAFAKAKGAALVLACYAAFEQICTLTQFSLSEIGLWFSWIVGLLPVACTLILFLLLGKGTAELLEKENQADAAKTATLVFGLKLGITLQHKLIALPLLSALFLLPPVSIGITVLVVALNVLVIICIYQSGNALQKAANIRAAQERMPPQESFPQNEPGGQES